MAVSAVVAFIDISEGAVPEALDAVEVGAEV
jgi:hypothetical protein